MLTLKPHTFVTIQHKLFRRQKNMPNPHLLFHECDNYRREICTYKLYIYCAKNADAKL